VPLPFNLEAVADKYPTAYAESMNTVVQQECIRYNKMLLVLLQSLGDILKALKGEVTLQNTIYIYIIYIYIVCMNLLFIYVCIYLSTTRCCSCCCNRWATFLRRSRER